MRLGMDVDNLFGNNVSSEVTLRLVVSKDLQVIKNRNQRP